MRDCLRRKEKGGGEVGEKEMEEEGEEKEGGGKERREGEKEGSERVKGRGWREDGGEEERGRGRLWQGKVIKNMQAQE